MLSVPAIARPQETATTANERIKTVTQKFGNTFPVRNPTKSPRYCQPTGGWDFNRGAAPAYPNAWVRLTRVGGLLSAYWSTNGVTWTLAATNTPALVGDLTPLPSQVYVGICTTAHNNDPFGTPKLREPRPGPRLSFWGVRLR